jgi:hypothetical protein
VLTFGPVVGTLLTDPPFLETMTALSSDPDGCAFMADRPMSKVRQDVSCVSTVFVSHRSTVSETCVQA